MKRKRSHLINLKYLNKQTNKMKKTKEIRVFFLVNTRFLYLKEPLFKYLFLSSSSHAAHFVVPYNSRHFLCVSRSLLLQISVEEFKLKVQFVCFNAC